MGGREVRGKEWMDGKERGRGEGGRKEEGGGGWAEGKRCIWVCGGQVVEGKKSLKSDW